MRQALGGKRQEHTYRCALVYELHDSVGRITTGEEIPSRKEVVSRLRNYKWEPKAGQQNFRTARRRTGGNIRKETRT